MGFSISGLLSDVGINLPKIDLGNIGSDIVNEGKQLLGDVVKDSFTLSNQPGQTFASDMNLNVLGDNVRLPNPIGSLANKLLGSADTELNKFGVNVDFKTILGKLFNLPTQAADGSTTSTAVPSLQTRAATGQLPVAVPGADATGGGAQAAASAAASVSGAMAVGGAPAANTASTPTSTGAVNSAIDPSMQSALNTAGTNLSQAMDDLKAAGSDPAKLQAAAAEMQQANEMFSIISQIMADNHQTRMLTIQNLK